MQFPMLMSDKAYELIKRQDLKKFDGELTDMEFPMLLER